MSTSYYFNQTRLQLDAVRNRRNFLETSSFRTEETSNQVNFNGNHRVSIRYEKMLDSLNTIVFISNSRLNNGSASLFRRQRLFRSNGVPSPGVMLPEVLSTLDTSRNTSESMQFGSANTLLYRHKFKKKGRSLAASATYQINTNDANLDLFSQNDFLGAISANDVIRRIINQDQGTNSLRNEYKANLQYIEPFAKSISGRRFTTLACATTKWTGTCSTWAT